MPQEPNPNPENVIPKENIQDVITEPQTPVVDVFSEEFAKQISEELTKEDFKDDVQTALEPPKPIETTVPPVITPTPEQVATFEEFVSKLPEELRTRKMSVKADGKVLEVSLEDLQKGFQMGTNYTRKMQELSDKVQKGQLYEEFLGALQSDPMGILNSLAKVYNVPNAILPQTPVVQPQIPQVVVEQGDDIFNTGLDEAEQDEMLSPIVKGQKQMYALLQKQTIENNQIKQVVFNMLNEKKAEQDRQNYIQLQKIEAEAKTLAEQDPNFAMSYYSNDNFRKLATDVARRSGNLTAFWENYQWGNPELRAKMIENIKTQQLADSLKGKTSVDGKTKAPMFEGGDVNLPKNTDTKSKSDLPKGMDRFSPEAADYLANLYAKQLG